MSSLLPISNIFNCLCFFTHELWMRISYIFIALEIINILHRILCVLYKNVHILYILQIYTQQFPKSTSGIVIHYTG